MYWGPLPGAATPGELLVFYPNRRVPKLVKSGAAAVDIANKLCEKQSMWSMEGVTEVDPELLHAVSMYVLREHKTDKSSGLRSDIDTLSFDRRDLKLHREAQDHLVHEYRDRHVETPDLVSAAESMLASYKAGTTSSRCHTQPRMRPVLQSLLDAGRVHEEFRATVVRILQHWEGL